MPIAERSSSAPAAESPIPSPRTESKPIGSFAVETCNTGLQRITGVVAEMLPSELAARLTKVYPLYAIVDFNKLPGQKPPEMAEASHLFDWLPAEAAHVSPQLLRKEELAGGIPFVEKAWGNDALVLLFSRKPSAELLTHCRLSAKSNHGSVFGYCWPSVLSALLSCYRKELIDRLMTGIDAVLIEGADGPEFWELYTKGDMAMVLSKIGLRTEVAKPQTAEVG